MIRAITAVTRRSLVKNFVPTVPVRGIKINRLFTEEEVAVGREKYELDLEKEGIVPFNRDPIIPDHDAGTKEKPIIVLSGTDVRAVGFEDPATHQVEWFNLHDGHLHFVPKINLYFKLERVGEDEDHGHGHH